PRRQAARPLARRPAGQPERTLRAAPSAKSAPRRRSAGRAALGALGFLLFLCVLAAMIAGSGYAGSQAGEQERNARATTTVQAYVMDRFQKCLDFMNAGNYSRAQAECETVQRFQPNIFGLRGMLATIVVAQTPTALPPVPTPTAVLTDKGELFRLLKAAWDKKEWDTVILLGDQLRALDVAYESASVAEWRYKALTTRGVTRLRAGNIEAGIFDLDIAEKIQKLDANTAAERTYAELYQRAMSTFGADWETAIRRLTQLFQVSPGYRDVASKLFQAYVGAGDAYAGLLDWCPAEKRFVSAQGLVPTAPGLEQKRLGAAQQCLTATPMPITGTATLTGTGTGGGTLGGGRLVYAGYDPAANGYSLFISDGGAPRAIGAGAGQPNYRNAGVVVLSGGGAVRTTAGASLLALTAQYASISPDGKRVAYSSGGALYVAGVGGAPAPASLGPGVWPAWGPGSQIVYQACLPAGCGLWLVNPDKPDEKIRLSEGAGDINPNWSPGGAEITYINNGDVYIVTIARQFRKLTSGLGAVSPTFSPDGARIAYQANRDGGWAVFVMGADGGGQRRVIDMGPQHPLAGAERMAWIP
ncbi:MAG: hypothetical protein ABIQ99_12110, partial [Thermoflexales bacterium]